MSTIDAQKLFDRLSAELLRFPERFADLLARPSHFFAEIAAVSEEHRRDLLKTAFVFALIAVVIGTGVGGFLQLEGTPQILGVGPIVAVLFLWFLVGLGLHPALRLFGANGTWTKTVAVFLFTVSALHILWVPVLGILSLLLSETRVVLTYEYAISFGASRGSSIEGLGSIARHTESFILEREPDKAGTVLPPASSDVTPYQATLTPRIPADASPYPPPTEARGPVLSAENWHILTAVLIAYITSHFYYLSRGFALVHGRAWGYWFLLAWVVPIAILMTIVILIALLTAAISAAP
ncbi:MAG: hypothetical protein AB3N15_16085 [Paracoccaceae bacterium]